MVDVATSDLSLELEDYRVELTGYCYRMLGSSFEADDAVQETMVRAWRSLDRFEGRSTLRSWLYSIATNVCLTLLQGRKRRAMPMDLASPASAVETFRPAPLPERTWVQPIASERAIPADGDPADLAVARETIRLAFVAALQFLPPRQRAVLILREVLRWQAAEVAELLDTSVASVNSALQRARATLAAKDVAAGGSSEPMDAQKQALLERYVDVFERFDVEAFVALLHEDATLSMPPDRFWLRGRDLLGAWWRGPGAKCAGSRVVPISVNGTPGCAAFRAAPDGAHEAFAVQVLETSDGLITAVHAFRDLRLFAQFGLPTRLEPSRRDVR